MANFKAITTTTYGYKDLTLNLLKSIEKNNIDLDIEVFVPDNKSEIFFQEHTKNISKFDEQKKSFLRGYFSFLPIIYDDL